MFDYVERKAKEGDTKVYVCIEFCASSVQQFLVGLVYCSPNLRVVFFREIILKLTIYIIKNYFIIIFLIFNNKWYLNKHKKLCFVWFK